MMIGQKFMNKYKHENGEVQTKDFLQRGCVSVRAFSKKIIFAAVVSAFSFAVAAQAQTQTQTQSQNEQIVLPDLTTVISTDDQTESALQLPPFEDVVELPKQTAGIIPEIDVQEEIVEQETETQPVQIVEQSDKFTVQGAIGGGAPSLFTGDFSLTQPESINPFGIEFSHHSQNGFAFSPFSDGFYKKTTLVKMSKAITTEKIKSSFGASYDEIQNGLQNQTEYETSVNQDTIALNGDFKWNAGNGITVNAALNSDFYFRFEDLLLNAFSSTETGSESSTQNAGSSAPDWIKGASTFSLGPKAGIAWEYLTKKSGNKISLNFDVLYNLEVLASKYVTGERALNRADLRLGFCWNNDIISTKANVGTIFSNRLNSNPVSVPFTVGVAFNIPVYFSENRLFIELEGGMKSEQKTTSQLEKLYAFTALSNLTSESSDWYSHFKMTVPLKSAFSASAQVDYAKTAFENGVWEPVYNDENYVSGLYAYTQKSHELLSTLFSLDFNYKIFSISSALKSNWNDIPALESKHFITFKTGIVSPQQKVGFNIEGGWHLDAEDSTPVVNSNFFVKINPAVTMQLTVSDLLKLTGNEKRIYAGKYISESGSICLSVKFVL